MSSKYFRALTLVLVFSLLLMPAAVLAGHETNAVHGTVFHDVNQDGVIDPGEVGLVGVVIELYNSVGLEDTVETDANGDYEFLSLEDDSYFVMEVDPAGYVSSTENQVEFTVNSSDPVPTINFGDVLFVEANTGSISGTVYDDINRSRGFDGGDVGLEGVSVLLKDADGLQLDDTETDADGNYSFDELFPGTYSLRELDPEGYYSTTAHEVTITIKLAGEAIEDVDFGDFIPEPGEVSPIDLPIARFFDLPLLDILEMRSIDGLGYGNIAKVYFLAYLSGSEVSEIMDLRGESGWGNVMKEVLGKAGLKGYNLGLIMSGREVPNQVQRAVDGCVGVATQEQIQTLMSDGANHATLKKLCDMVTQAGGTYDNLLEAIQMRNDKMKWKDIEQALEDSLSGGLGNSQNSDNESNNGNGPPACKGKNKNDSGCK